jgi:hypothetical protein
LELLAHRAVFDRDVRWVPPSSSDLADRKALFRHLLLQIGGANIENPPPSSTLAANTTSHHQKFIAC